MPANANRTKRLIAGDEREFPLEVLRRWPIKSVTGVTNGLPGPLYDLHHKMLFSGAFLLSAGRFAIAIAEIAMSR
ncbi:MAG TPA: hypothetical protein VGH47_02255 [Xanthobacteraceae bacterium]